jgi:transcription elongation factor GreB
LATGRYSIDELSPGLKSFEWINGAMSRGFVREGDQEEIPLIPERAPLPAGQFNYVTPEGYRLLSTEQATLEKEIETTRNTLANESERRVALTVLTGKMRLLQERLHSAKVLQPTDMPQDEVRFGARVVLRARDGSGTQSFQIVGVDEADVKASKVSFIAPIARAVTGKKVGNPAELYLGGNIQEWQVESIAY